MRFARRSKVSMRLAALAALVLFALLLVSRTNAQQGPGARGGGARGAQGLEVGVAAPHYGPRP
jgi:hypothetical protein